MKKVLVFILIFNSFGLFAQTEPPSNLSGSDLRTWLKDNWYTGIHNSLGYSGARETMFGFIDKNTADNQVYCVYTGYHHTAAFTTTLGQMNTEHTIPQSWFDESSVPRSDLFHLYPTDADVNNARSNHPFDEITDTETETWYTVNTSTNTLIEQTTIPTSNIEAYSEHKSTEFEPREDHKGNLARSAFYFYTMYSASSYPEIETINKLADIQTLYQWHLQDPVDAAEQLRNERIKSEQGNRNPYIDYPDMACRAWSDYGIICTGIVHNPQSFTATGVSDSQINLAWTLNTDNDKVVVAYNTTSTFGTPVDGTTYTEGNAITGGGTVLYVGTLTAFNHTGLSSQTYYYKIWSQATDNSFSTGLTAQASPLVGEPASNVTNFTVTAETSTTISLSWTGSAGGQLPSYYLIKASTGTVADPADGTPVADGTLAKNVAYGTNVVTFSGLTPSTLYNFKIYPYTNSGTNINYLTNNTPQVEGTTTEAILPTIFISEIAGKGYATDFNDEYIELTNLGGTSQSLTGWTLEYYEGVTAEVTLNLTGSIAANSTYVIAVRTAHTSAITPNFTPATSFSLNNPCYVILKNNSVSADQAGSSTDKFSEASNWEFSNCTADNLPVANWVNLASANGTPGVVNCDGIGVNSLLGNQISVYPNPTQNTITVSNININDKILIVNYLGQNILNVNAKSENQIIDLSKQSEGIYFVLIYEDNKLIKTQKIIKRK
jgi:endonuclease I